jgi:hypothetical protein
MVKSKRTKIGSKQTTRIPIVPKDHLSLPIGSITKSYIPSRLSSAGNVTETRDKQQKGHSRVTSPKENLNPKSKQQIAKQAVSINAKIATFFRVVEHHRIFHIL